MTCCVTPTAMCVFMPDALHDRVYMSGLLLILSRGGSRVGHRRIVSRFGSHVQVLDAFRRIDLQAKLAPLSVLGSIGRMITDHVLVLELHCNFRADVF